MKPSNTKIFVASFLLSVAGAAPAQFVDIEVVNGNTREKKSYTGGSSDFRIPVDFVQGWSHCIAKKIKTYTFYGEMARAEVYRFGKNGTAQRVACVTAKDSLAVIRTDLFGGTFRFVDDDNITVPSSAEILITCRY